MKTTSQNLGTKKANKRHSEISKTELRVEEIFPPEGAIAHAGRGAVGALAALLARKTREMIDSGALVVVDGVVMVAGEKQ